MTDEQLQRADIDFLMQREEFRRFFLRVIQMSGIFSLTTNGSRDEAVAALARRNLGLEILEMVEADQPRGQPIDGVPASTLTHIFLEEARRPKPEKPNGRKSSQYDRTTELQDDPADVD